MTETIKIIDKKTQKELVRKKLMMYVEQINELVAMEDVSEDWKRWLTSASSWLSFATAHFSESELKIATEIARRGKVPELVYIHSLIKDYQENPWQTMMTIKQAFETFGPITPPVEEPASISEGYAAETGYASPSVELDNLTISADEGV